MSGRAAPAPGPAANRRALWSSLAAVLCATQLGCSDDVMRLGQTAQAEKLGSVDRLILRDTVSAAQIQDLIDTTPISVADLKARKIALVSLEAVASGPVASVNFLFDLLPMVNEHQVPFIYPGDFQGKLGGFAPKEGTHTIKATPFSAPNGVGAQGTSLEAQLTFVP